MARSPYNRSPSPGFDASSQLSDSSIEDNFAYPEPSEAGQSISRQGSPSQLEGKPQDENGVDTMTCQWEECGKIFNHLPSLIDHIHNDHIGVHKSNYTCEWKTCPRRGIAQTSRFALISHIRSHTGEKPFICPRPECDKSFTRSDALAKHMRIQHNILPPLPGRGGNRKRKREEPEASQPTGDGYSSFKVEQQHSHASGTAPDYYEDGRVSPLEPNGYGEPLQNGVLRTRSDSPDGEDDSGEDEGIPPHLMSVMDPGTGLIMGRSPAMVKYLLMKAKHKYVLGEHEDLIEELRTLRHEEKCWRERKDALLDEVLRSTFGGQAEELTMLPPVHAQSVPVHRGDVEEDEYV